MSEEQKVKLTCKLSPKEADDLLWLIDGGLSKCSTKCAKERRREIAELIAELEQIKNGQKD